MNCLLWGFFYFLFFFAFSFLLMYPTHETLTMTILSSVTISFRMFTIPVWWWIVFITGWWCVSGWRRWMTDWFLMTKINHFMCYVFFEIVRGLFGDIFHSVTDLSVMFFRIIVSFCYGWWFTAMSLFTEFCSSILKPNLKNENL